MGKVLALRAKVPSGWNRERWLWMHAVMAAPGLNSTAKLIAVVLAQTYANNESAECFPGLKKLMAAINAPKRTVMKALADLSAAEWIVVLGKSARGRPAAYAFRTPDGTNERVQDSAKERVQDSAITGAETRFPPTPPYKDKPNMNHTEPLHPRVAIRGQRRPDCRTKLVAPESTEAQRWDAWLDERGYPPLARIGHRDLDTGYYEMPVTSAPDKYDTVSHGIAIRWADWLRSKA